MLSQEKPVKSDLAGLVEAVRGIHAQLRDGVLKECERQSCGEMAAIAEDGEGDTIYAIDRVSETQLVRLFEERVAVQAPILLIAEGLSGGKVMLPRGTPESRAAWRVIADPVDGTRCLMYQKRPAWILTGIAPNRGEETNLADVEAAVQTEIPLLKQHLCDTLWAFRGAGARGERFNRISGERTALKPSPSSAGELAQGFSTISRFFAGGRDILAAMDDEIHFQELGPGAAGKARAFEDQYLSTGGQLYELMMGHDRFIADFRPLLAPILQERGLPVGLCCHPYDLCTELVAREAGVVIGDEMGRPLQAPLNVDANVSWVGYANQNIRARIEPRLRAALQKHGLLEHA